MSACLTEPLEWLTVNFESAPSSSLSLVVQWRTGSLGFEIERMQYLHRGKMPLSVVAHLIALSNLLLPFSKKAMLKVSSMSMQMAASYPMALNLTP
jgi:hypothetical protein